nr:cytochrome C oxidase subunit II [uncultured Lichenicoccus sp.]
MTTPPPSSREALLLSPDLSRGLCRCVVLCLAAFCGGCSTAGFWLIHPAGPVAAASLQSWIVDTGATFLVIGPATLLVLWAIWRYHRRYGKGAYIPGWSHSVPLEATFWGVPLVVVIGLGLYATHSSFQTDPSGPGAMAAGRNPLAAKQALEIDVITTDWQWLFIYPDRHIALANELVIPVLTPVRFRLTSATVATDFFIPQLAGQIDVMPGMRTWQGLIADRIGSYQGFATDYNGPGFSWMRFTTRVVSAADFQTFETAVAQAPAHLDDATFVKFAAPTINTNDITRRYSAVEDHLFDHVMGQRHDGQDLRNALHHDRKGVA